MTTLTKIIIAAIMSAFLVSCNLDFGVQGNGNVSTVERNLEDDFNRIEASRGLDVYLTQSDTKMLKVQADENLHDLIITEVEDETLKIYTAENIGRCESKKVMVNVSDLSLISATSGSDVYSTNTLVANDIKLVTTSGSDMEVDLEAQSTTLAATSGSDIKIAGSTTTLSASATSGSDIKASKFISKTCTAAATSGADVEVYVEESLSAGATSGGDIRYHGNPKKVSKKDSSAGSVKAK